MRKRVIGLLTVLSGVLLGLCGCDKAESVKSYYVAPVAKEDYCLSIEPVEGISDDFIRGVDASEVLALENSNQYIENCMTNRASNMVFLQEDMILE